MSNPSLPSLDIYLIAVGGTGMAPLACLLRELGHRVRGSDGPLYPPMSDLLQAAGIVPHVGFDAAHLAPRPDLVIVGNAVPRDNVEAAAAETLNLPRCSMPEAVRRFLLTGKDPLVVAGSHGKTTTSSMAAWVYTYVGEAPGYLIGGWPIGLATSFGLASGRRFVIEGDEYNAAYFDRGPKFLHYQPQTLILTSAEHDHVDLYPRHQDLLARFEQLIRTLPPSGLLVAGWDDPQVRELAAAAPCRVIGYGKRSDAQLRLEGWSTHPEGTRALVRLEGETVELSLRLFGEHNALNATAVLAAAVADGVSPKRALAALSEFLGVRRRLELLGEAQGIAVVDDFAHHPTEVTKSLQGLAARFPQRRLVTLFEPRSLTAGRAMFHQHYVEAFSCTQVLVLAPIFHAGRLSADERLDRSRLADELEQRGVEVAIGADIDQVFEITLAVLRPGDVVVTMSSGAFGAMPRRLLEALGESVVAVR